MINNAYHFSLCLQSHEMVKLKVLHKINTKYTNTLISTPRLVLFYFLNASLLTEERTITSHPSQLSSQKFNHENKLGQAKKRAILLPNQQFP